MNNQGKDAENRRPFRPVRQNVGQYPLNGVENGYSEAPKHRYVGFQEVAMKERMVVANDF
jgi:hypothetical protein